MNISVFGLGYVGVVSAVCLARDGHTVIGIDANPHKMDLVNSGLSPIVEKDIPELIAKVVADGRLRATADISEAISATEISLVCVGTPSQPNGGLDIYQVKKVCEEIGHALREKSAFHVVVIRSTMLPGSMRNIVIPTLEACSGKSQGVGFGVCNNPEFMREGTAVYDYYHPPKTVIGETDSLSGDKLVSLYSNIEAPLIRTSVNTAEMVKYADNTWHALKVTFANEIGNLCKALGLDGHDVMEIFCQDYKLNLSSYYMKPGFAFGGSCLPKDVRALNYKAKTLDLELPLINSIIPSNEKQIQKGISMVLSHGKKRVGILGFAFKAGTDDLRESPLVTLIEALLGKGLDIKVYDRNVSLAAISGANRNYIINHIPHISKLMLNSIDDIMDFSELIVIGNNDEQFKAIPTKIRPGQIVIDLVGILRTAKQGDLYDGICW